ncbi:uncharacterized protein LOC141718750 [Apium graveolens]|uniref:uncharacterized protein LOC141718750 n=1 Tax=Apium graveolens TaxID=4045 RepID=UPI003D790EB8
MTRSSLKEMKLPPKLWAEGVRNAIYIFNRLLTRALTNQTPYEVWESKKPEWPWDSLLEGEDVQETFSVPELFDTNEEAHSDVHEPANSDDYDYSPQSEIHGESSGENSGQGRTGTSPQTSELQTQAETPSYAEQSSTNIVNRDNYDDNTTPKKFRSIRSIYQTLDDEELHLMGIDEPVNYAQAVKDVKWRDAMKQEMNSIEANETWRLMELPPDQKIIGLKWIYKLKKDANGKVVKHKARLVAKGYVQEHGIDFDEVYAPVTHIEIVRLLLALAAKE